MRLKDPDTPVDEALKMYRDAKAEQRREAALDMYFNQYTEDRLLMLKRIVREDAHVLRKCFSSKEEKDALKKLYEQVNGEASQKREHEDQLHGERAGASDSPVVPADVETRVPEGH